MWFPHLQRSFTTLASNIVTFTGVYWILLAVMQNYKLSGNDPGVPCEKEAISCSYVNAMASEGVDTGSAASQFCYAGGYLDIDGRFLVCITCTALVVGFMVTWEYIEFTVKNETSEWQVWFFGHMRRVFTKYLNFIQVVLVYPQPKPCNNSHNMGRLCCGTILPINSLRLGIA